MIQRLRSGGATTASLVILFAALPATGGCASSDKAMVAVPYHYTTVPRMQLPGDIKTISVEAPNPHITRPGETGVIMNRDQAFYDVLIKQLEARFSQHGIQVVDRRDIISRHTEQEREALNGADPEAPVARAERFTDAKIIPRISISTRQWVEQERKSPLHDAVRKGFDLIPSGGGRFIPLDRRNTKSVERLQVSVACTMDIIATRTGAAFAPYSGSLTSRIRSSEGDWGYGDDRVADQTSDHEELDDLIQRHADLFVGQFFTLLVQGSIEAHLGHVTPLVAQAVDELNSGNSAEARRLAEEAYEADRKDHEACFVAGVAEEVQGNFAESKRWYQKALTEEPKEETYREAKQRVSGQAQHGNAVVQAGR